MKSKKISWIDKKLKDSQFRQDVEEEYRKLSIGEQLLHLRQAAHLTQAQVAEKVGTTGSAISRYENASYSRYELNTVRKIVEACGGHLKLIFDSQEGSQLVSF
ncbi:MAG: helix-turn-helix domain-containing protein [Deltaproteobacteria bacterium]|nr:helix-turn-helix domain-containing protein [Deltaproteobacteria bacterium]